MHHQHVKLLKIIIKISSAKSNSIVKVTSNTNNRKSNNLRTPCPKYYATTNKTKEVKDVK